MLVVTQNELLDLEKRVVTIEDARGLNCPMPILRTKKALAKLEAGQMLKVLTTDSSAVADLTVFTKQTGHRLCAQVEDGDCVAHYVCKRSL